jgi:hypothetical protein
MSKLKKAVKIIERLRGERNLLKQQLDDVCADRAFLKKRRDGYEESCVNFRAINVELDSLKSKCSKLEQEIAIKDREIAQLHAKLDQISLARNEPCETCISLRKHIDLMLDRSDKTKEEIQLLQDQSEKTNVEIQFLQDQIALMQIRLEIAHKELDQRAAPTQMLQEKTSSMYGSDDDDDTEPSRAILAYKPTQTDRQETRESEDFNFFDDPVKPIATPATTAAIAAATAAIAAAAAATAPTVVATRKMYVGLGGANPYFYEDSIQEIINTKLAQGERVFDVKIDGESHKFNLDEMRQYAPERWYAVRECDHTSRAAFVDIGGEWFPYEKETSDQICEAIDQQTIIKRAIPSFGPVHIIDGKNQCQINEKYGHSCAIKIFTV